MQTGALQLQRQVNSPIYDARQQFAGTHGSLRVIFDFLCSSTAAVIESALLMLLIGWIDYTTDFNVTVFYFVPVVLATWRAGRKAGWFIAVLCGATVLIADLMVPRSGRVIALSYINAGILVLASAALAELVISSASRTRTPQGATRAKDCFAYRNSPQGEEQSANRIQLAPAPICQVR